MEKTTNARLVAYSPEASSTGKAEEVQVMPSETWEKVLWCRILKNRTRNSHFTKKGDEKYKDRSKTFTVGYTMSFYGDKLNNHDTRNSAFFCFTFCG